MSCLMKPLTQKVATWMVQFNNQFNGHLGGRCVATWMVQFNNSHLVLCAGLCGPQQQALISF